MYCLPLNPPSFHSAVNKDDHLGSEDMRTHQKACKSVTSPCLENILHSAAG